jgi:predicted ATP-grasp superfamily ATP-dependent carboligase
MEEITKNASRGDLIPVLLGLAPKTIETAKSLYHSCDAVSHVFCGSVPFPLRFSLCMKFHRVGHTENEELMLRALLDFSNQIGNGDTILYLVPCTREYLKMIKQNRELLESIFVIALPNVQAREEGTEGGARI